MKIEDPAYHTKRQHNQINIKKQKTFLTESSATSPSRDRASGLSFMGYQNNFNLK